MAEMSPSDLTVLVDQQIKSAVGYDGSTLTDERQENWRYYKGEPFGNERDGRSQIVSRDVMDTVEWIMPSLVEAFHGTDEPFEFAPRTAEDEEGARQATDYVNYVYQYDNPGFEITYSWQKDGLISKVGVVKHWWDECEKVEEETFTGLSPDEMTMIGSSEGVEIVEHTANKGQDDQGQPYETHDIKIRRKVKYGRVKVETLPPEEFLISPRAKSIETAGFVAHRRSISRSDLIGMGFKRDLVESIPADEDRDNSADVIERFQDEDRTSRDDGRTDKAMQMVTLSECYVRVDYDGDGVAELRKVIVGGTNSKVLLENEMADEAPFTLWSPILMPHTVQGLALVDAVKELQLIKSTVWRQMMDGIYLTTSPRMKYVIGQVEPAQLLNMAPGALIGVNNLDAVAPLDQPWDGAKAFPMLEYIDRARDARTGTGQSAMAMNPDALNNQAGADANSRMMTQAEARVKLIARVFAEVAFKRLALSILKLLIRHQDKPRVVRLRNKYVSVDPRSWNSDMDVIVKVGLGTGEKVQQFQSVNLIAQKQEQILLQLGPNNPLCGLPQYFATLKELVRLGGLRSAEPYFTDPSEPDPKTGQPKELPPPPPDPKMVEVQQKGQLAQQQAQMDMQMSQAKMQADAQMQQAKLAGDAQAAQQKAELEEAKMEREHQLKREQIAAELQLKREQLAAELQLKQQQFEAEIAMNERLEMQRIETQKHVGAMNAAAKVDIASSRVTPGGEPG